MWKYIIYSNREKGEKRKGENGYTNDLMEKINIYIVNE